MSPLRGHSLDSRSPALKGGLYASRRLKLLSGSLTLKKKRTYGPSFLCFLAVRDYGASTLNLRPSSYISKTV